MRKFLLAMGGSEVGWSRHNDEGTFRDYEAEVDRLFESAKPWDLECIRFNNEYIYNLPYYEEHRDVLDRVSFGFCFKAIGFTETFKQMEEGDIALFVDSNHVIVDPSIYYDVADHYGVYIHDHIWNMYLNKHWTRRDTFVNMKCDEERYWNSLHMQCNIIGLKKTPLNSSFVNELLKCDLDYNIMFGNGEYENLEGFIEHRHDQSVFSILREKYEFPFLDRTASYKRGLRFEHDISEESTITPKNPIDNTYRREADRKDIRK